MEKARRRRDRPEDSFVGLRGHSAYQEAPEVSLWLDQNILNLIRE